GGLLLREAWGALLRGGVNGPRRIEPITLERDEPIARNAVVAFATAVDHRTRIAAREECLFAEKALTDRVGNVCAVRIEADQLVIQLQRYGDPVGLLRRREVCLVGCADWRGERGRLRAIDD